MRYNRHMRNWMIGISVLFLIITIIFSVLQVNYQEKAIYAIINNVSICILTGCLIALIQFIIGYHNSKHNNLLIYYKDLIMLEKKIIFYPYSQVGFIDAVSGLKDVQEILNFYDSNVKLSYLQIDFDGQCDDALNAARELFDLYKKQIKTFKDMEGALCDGIRFMEKSDEDLFNDGITDIPKASQEMNAILQSKEKEIEFAYNDVNEQKKRNEAYVKLEKYLFNKKGENGE